jgi:excisionase family DNA binding protein
MSMPKAMLDEQDGSSVQMREDLLSVKEAAKQLRVSEPTVWRWINQLLLPAYRVGQKRVYVKRADLEPLITPAREKGGLMPSAERGRVKPLTLHEREQVLDAVQESRRRLTQMLEARGGRLYTRGRELLEQVREERSEHLS